MYFFGQSLQKDWEDFLIVVNHSENNTSNCHQSSSLSASHYLATAAPLQKLFMSFVTRLLLHVLIVELHFALCPLEILLIKLYFFASKGVQRCSCKPDDEYLLSSDITRDLSFEDEPAVEFKSYKRRFYILLLFSVIAFSQYCAWNTYGPIATTTKMVFGWTNTQIAFLASMDPITYLCTMQFFSWMMDEKGILTLYFSLAVGFPYIETMLRGEIVARVIRASRVFFSSTDRTLAVS